MPEQSRNDKAPYVGLLSNRDVLDFAETIGWNDTKILQSIAASLVILARLAVKYTEDMQCQMPEHNSIGPHFH